MITIIKSGDCAKEVKYKIPCMCGCVFECDGTDLNTTKLCMIDYRKHIFCPECKARLEVNEMHKIKN